MLFDFDEQLLSIVPGISNLKESEAIKIVNDHYYITQKRRKVLHVFLLVTCIKHLRKFNSGGCAGEILKAICYSLNAIQFKVISFVLSKNVSC